MARKPAEGEISRSQFIRDMIKKNPKVKCKAVIDAWQELGHKEPIKPTLFYLTKSNMKRKGGGARRADAGVADDQPNDTKTAFLDIESSLDRLIAKANEIRDARLADDLRVARRRISARLV